MAVFKVADVKLGALDAAGAKIDTVYYLSDGDHAIFRTTERVVIQYADNGGENQLWTLKRTTRDRYVIVNKHSGLVLSAMGNTLTQQKEDGSAAQQWLLRPAS